MKISPTPWKVSIDVSGEIYISAADGGYVAGIDSDEQSEADARFLVAAVNACAGYDVESLEDPDW